MGENYNDILNCVNIISKKYTLIFNFALPRRVGVCGLKKIYSVIDIFIIYYMHKENKKVKIWYYIIWRKVTLWWLDIIKLLFMEFSVFFMALTFIITHNKHLYTYYKYYIGTYIWIYTYNSEIGIKNMRVHSHNRFVFPQIQMCYVTPMWIIFSIYV